MNTHPLTFLFTDLEGSTRLWEEHPVAMRPVLARHDSLLRDAVESHNGQIVKTTGDGLHAVFESPADAVAAALQGQQGLSAEGWPEEIEPLRVRMGLHTGEGQARDGDYYGPAINRAARVMATAHGGQVLLSSVAAALARSVLPEDVTLLDLGEHRLRDLATSEHLYQLCHPALNVDFPPLKSLSAYKHNLPVQLSSFIGRKRELAEVKNLLIPDTSEAANRARLITLLGPGGTGKTRLMLQAAADIVDHFTDGIWLVELAALTDPELLAERCAAALNIQEQRGQPILDTLTSNLRNKQLLLLLDNVEHLVRECAQLAEHLLRHCPRLKLLVTGREGLFIEGETMLQIPSLAVPDTVDGTTPDQICEIEAVQLFVARAQAVRADFELTAQNAPAVAELVRRLDGIPLALELAAARVRVFSAEQINARLNDRFRLLTGGRRTVLPRQQTLQALIDWSWNLLENDEQVLLARLSVFAGGWTLEAAEEVAGIGGADIWGGLDQLVNKSLVITDHAADGSVRYRMLESIRQYAEAKLFDAGEGEIVRDRHAEYFTAYGETAWEAMAGPDMLIWLDRVLPETENGLAAREWALENRLDLALRLGDSFFLMMRYWADARTYRRWLERLEGTVNSQSLDKDDPHYLEAKAITKIGLGTSLFGMGHNTRSVALLAEGCDFARQAGMIRQLVFGLNMQVVAMLNYGELEKAFPLAEEALNLTEGLAGSFMRVMTLNTLPSLLAARGEHQLAAEYIEEANRTAQEIGNPWLMAMSFQIKGHMEKERRHWAEAFLCFETGMELFQAVRDSGFTHICRSELAHILRLQGDFADAMQIYRETIRYFQEYGLLAAVAHQLECIGYIKFAQGMVHDAARLLGAATAIRTRDMSRRVPNEQDEFDRVLAQLTDSMGESAHDAAMSEGQMLSLDEAVALAIQSEGEAV